MPNARADLAFVVEPMKVSDIDAVAAIDRGSFSTPWSSWAYRHEILNNPLSSFVVVRLQQAAVGTAPASDTASRIRKWPFGGSKKPGPIGYGGFWVLGDEAHISTIAVESTYRRQGIGELLLLTMIEGAMEKGATLVTLEVRVSNLAAQNLYHKYGFRPVGRRPGYYASEREDALIMTVEDIASEDYQARLEALREALLARRRTFPVLEHS